jgi:hypothetical protein
MQSLMQKWWKADNNKTKPSSFEQKWYIQKMDDEKFALGHTF